MSIIKNCEQCKQDFECQFKYRNKQRFCCRKYADDFHKGKDFRKNKVTKATHPEWAQSIKDTMIKNEVNRGDKNAIKRPEIADKVAKSRSKRFKEDIEFRNQTATLMRQAWASGKYDGVK